MENMTGADFKSATADDNRKLFIETYGCQMNVADSEVIASVMQMAGYSVADTLEEADAVFMNTCSIRDNAEQKILNRLEFFHSLKKKKKNLIVGVLGCFVRLCYICQAKKTTHYDNIYSMPTGVDSRLFYVWTFDGTRLWSRRP